MGSRDVVKRDSDGTVVDVVQEEAEHAHLTANAKRIILVDSTGTVIGSANPLPVDTELTLDGNVIIDNVTVFATDISDSSTKSFGLVNSLGHQVVQPGVIEGRTFKYEDASFVTGESPRTLDVNTDLGRNAVDGYITCDGPGNILVEISDDGATYGGQHTLKVEDTLDLKNINVDSIRIAWVTDSAYRIMVV